MSLDVMTLALAKSYTDQHSGGGAQADLSQTDTTKPDYVKGVIRQESLPEGYPYKEQSETVIGEVTVDAEFAGISFAVPFYDTDGNLFCIEEGKQYRVVFDGKEYNCVGIKRSERIHYVSATGETEVSESNVFFYKTCAPTNINERNCALVTLASDSGHTFSIDEVSETIHLIAPEFLPYATTTTLGAVK